MENCLVAINNHRDTRCLFFKESHQKSFLSEQFLAFKLKFDYMYQFYNIFPAFIKNQDREARKNVELQNPIVKQKYGIPDHYFSVL